MLSEARPRADVTWRSQTAEEEKEGGGQEPRLDVFTHLYRGTATQTLSHSSIRRPLRSDRYRPFVGFSLSIDLCE